MNGQSQLFPDVLGMLTTDRLTVDDVVQCALGVFPNATALDQPVEALLLVQSLIDQPLPLQISIRTPNRDDKGKKLNFAVPRSRFSVTLPPGDCGLIHLPVTPKAPTPPGGSYPIHVQIAAQAPNNFNLVRPLTGGLRPSLLAISPFRLAVLSDINFSARRVDTHQIKVSYDVLPGNFPRQSGEPEQRYVPLWTLRDHQKEQERVQTVADEARRTIQAIPRNFMMTVLEEHTADVFGDAGMPLHPGEARFITKLLTYVLEDGLELERGFSLSASAWFKRLCQLLADDPNVANSEVHLLQLLYSAALQDAAMVGFQIVAFHVSANFGGPEERADYAGKLVSVVERRIPAALEHVYLPLVMAGAVLIAQITTSGENPWESLAMLKEARNGRVSLAGAAFREVFDILDQLIERAENLLTEMRIPPP